jgi:hypothetical protein
VKIELTSKHSPNRDDERARILAAHGWITEEKYVASLTCCRRVLLTHPPPPPSVFSRELYFGRLHRMDLEDQYILQRAEALDFTSIYRVCGEIAVSRSIGMLLVTLAILKLLLSCLLGDIPYKGYTPGKVVNEPFVWPHDHNQVSLSSLS